MVNLLFHTNSQRATVGLPITSVTTRFLVEFSITLPSFTYHSRRMLLAWPYVRFYTVANDRGKSIVGECGGDYFLRTAGLKMGEAP